MSKYLVTYDLMGDLEYRTFGSEKGVAEFLRRHPDIVHEDYGLQIIEIKRECTVHEFLNASFAS
jgi:hypothetical protein